MLSTSAAAGSLDVRQCLSVLKGWIKGVDTGVGDGGTGQVAARVAEG